MDLNLLNLSRTKRGNEVGSILDWLRWRRGEARSLINLVARRVGGGVEWPPRRETRSETTRSREERRGCRRARLRET